ncbi:MAG: cytochrome P450 [Actinomycetota bacterium]
MTNLAKRPVEDFATDWDHTDPRWVENPYPIWEDLRTRCPVAHTERFEGGWFPTTHEYVSEIANDTEHFTSRTVVVGSGRPSDDAPPAPIGVAPPISSDPPFHQIARRLILPAFAPRPINALEPQIREYCETLLDRVEGHAVIDGGEDFAQHIPPAVISKMLGFPAEDEEVFREIVNVTLKSADLPPFQRLLAILPGYQYFMRQIQDHRDNPRDDLTSFLINAEINGEPLTEDHIRGTMVLVLVAGIDTTWSAIGSALWHLASHPEDLARLVNEPELMPVAIEEFLRFYAPVTMARLVKEDYDFHGHPMKKDDWILLGFPAANRDPEAFVDADKFIIDRAINRHAAFGLGIHRCAGSNLARLEMRVALETFIKRYPSFTLDDPEAVTWAPGQVRGPRHLPIRVR